MHRLALCLLGLLVGTGLQAAEADKPREISLTSTNLAGRSSLLVATVPAGFTATIKDLPGPKDCWQALSAESADQRVQLLITLMPPDDFLQKDAAGLEMLLHKTSAPFVGGSVEGKVTPLPLKLTHGIGVATIFSDKSEVGKPAAKGRGHYKLLTNGIIRVGDATLASVTVFSDSKEAAGYLDALKLVASLRPTK